MKKLLLLCILFVILIGCENPTGNSAGNVQQVLNNNITIKITTYENQTFYYTVQTVEYGNHDFMEMLLLNFGDSTQQYTNFTEIIKYFKVYSE